MPEDFTPAQLARQVEKIRKACCWPPIGNRGVGFSRANLFGKHFDEYQQEAQSPMLIAQIENINELLEEYKLNKEFFTYDY